MITVHNLSYTYPKAEMATIKDISFQVQKGEIFGFLGPSGAGKSTTQKIMIGLLKGFQGHVLINDKQIQEWKNNLYYQIGVGFELPNHYSKLTALENLRFFASFYGVKTQNLYALLEKVGLASDATKKVADFSKGMKMRLNFVRALLHNPPILFLDEPTSGLDPVNAKIIKDSILQLKEEGKTIILTTHHMNDADQLCDRLAFMVDGKFALIDSPKALKQRYGKRIVEVEYGNPVRLQQFDMDSLATNMDFQQLIQTETIQSIHSQESTLERIFIEVTGKKLINN